MKPLRLKQRDLHIALPFNFSSLKEGKSKDRADYGDFGNMTINELDTKIRRVEKDSRELDILALKSEEDTDALETLLQDAKDGLEHFTEYKRLILGRIEGSDWDHNSEVDQY